MIDFVFKYNSLTYQQIKSLFYENILFIINKSFGLFFSGPPCMFIGSDVIIYQNIRKFWRPFWIYSISSALIYFEQMIHLFIRNFINKINIAQHLN